MKDNIKELTHREQARMKLPVFYGSRDNYIHGLKEVINNAVDEIKNNFKKGEITVKLHDDMRTITVQDTGRGIPMADKTGDRHNYQLLFETLFAGSNYENESTGKIATGTNGLGITVLNYTSELFEVVSTRDNTVSYIRYRNGGEREEYRSEILKSVVKPQSGTIFTFRLDKKVYTNTTYTKEEILDVVKKIAATSDSIRFTFLHGEERHEFHYKTLLQVAEEEWKDNTSRIFTGERVGYDKEGERNDIQIVYGTSSTPLQHTFLNSNFLPEHGTIYDGIVNGAKLFFNRHIRNQKVKSTGSITNDDIVDSMNFIVVVDSVKVEYANQTKLSTSKALYKTIAQEQIQIELEKLRDSNATQFKKMLDHIITVNKHNEKNTKAKQLLKKKLTEKVDNITNKIENLVDCKEHGENAELYIAEGHSALGSIVLSRDATFQAAFPLRGKILNCLKEKDITKVLSNKIIVDLIKVLGCGVELDKKHKDLDSFDVKNLRYGNIFIACDADSDGYQIACLILTIFYKLMPTLLIEGRVHIVQTPLYELKMKDGSMKYLFSESDKNENLHKYDYRNIARCKGLGELSVETMAFCGMDKETRITYKVSVSDVEEMSKVFDVWMGDGLEERRSIIMTELNNYEGEI